MPHGTINYAWREPFTNRDGARAAGCEFLHVGFDQDLRDFYIDACGFEPILGGLMELT